MDADNLGHDPADLGRRVELAFALTALGRKVPHQIFVGVAQNIIAIGPVLRKVEGVTLKDPDQVAQPFGFFFPIAQLAGLVEVREIRPVQLVVRRHQGRDDLLVDLVPDIRLALQLSHVPKAAALGDRDRGKRLTGVLVRDVLQEQQHEDVILVLTGIHPTAQLIAASPKGRIQF